MFPAVGNHEEDGGRAELFGRYFAPPTESSGKEEYYAFTYGNSRFIVMDTHVHDISGGPNFEQGAWLDRELQADHAGVAHKFVVMHHGPYSSKPGRSGNWAVVTFWLDKFKAAGVGMVISGHDHYYERGEDGRGMRYAIVGGGGAPLYDTEGPGSRGGREIFVSRSVLSFVTVTVMGGRVEGCAKGVDGAAIDCFAWGEAAPGEPDGGDDAPPDDAGGGDPGPEPNPEPDPGPDPGGVECLGDADCTDRAPMDHCAGRWVCTTQTCEWTCDQAAPGAPGDTDAPDAAPGDGGSDGPPADDGPAGVPGGPVRPRDGARPQPGVDAPAAGKAGSVWCATWATWATRGAAPAWTWWWGRR